VKNYGSIKGYLFLQMQVAVLAALIISILSSFYYDFSIMVAQILPAIILVAALSRFRKDYKSESMQYVALFTVFMLIALLAPFTARSAMSGNPFAAAQYVFYGLVVLLLGFVTVKYALSRNYVEGKVLLSDGDTAAVLIDFDMMAGIRAGKYVVKNRGAKKGQKVKVKIKKSFFGKVEPVEVIR
jgi:uncharacterized membrane protein